MLKVKTQKILLWHIIAAGRYNHCHSSVHHELCSMVLYLLCVCAENLPSTFHWARKILKQQPRLLEMTFTCIRFAFIMTLFCLISARIMQCPDPETMDTVVRLNQWQHLELVQGKIVIAAVFLLIKIDLDLYLLITRSLNEHWHYHSPKICIKVNWRLVIAPWPPMMETPTFKKKTLNIAKTCLYCTCLNMFILRIKGRRSPIWSEDFSKSY